MTTALVCSFGGGVFVRISSCNEFGCCAKLPGPNSWRRVGVSARCGQPVCSLQTSLRGFPEARDGAGNGSSESEVHTGKGVRSRELPHIQTLRELPREELFAKVVLVRFDSTILLQDEIKSGDESVYDAVFTIRYLHEAGAKVVLVSDWSSKVNPKVTSAQSVAGILSSILRLKVSPTQSSFSYTPSSVKRYDDVEVVLLENLHKCKGELANFYEFSQQLSAGVDIFVNDAFSQSHKILASTVGITGSCYASVAGFHFEESLNKLKKAAISNWMMSFQVMHALGLHVPPSLVDHKSVEEVKILVQTASSRRIPIICPKDFWCVSSHHPQQLGLVRDHELFEDLIPIDIGPESLEKIKTLLIKCEKLLWIGPVRFKQPTRDVRGTSKLVYMLDQLFQQKCDVTVVGSESCKAVVEESVCASLYRMFENATVVWEYLAGRKLPAVMALDRAWSSEIDWQTTYADAVHPLVVDIGSGNGKFLFGMAKIRKDFNFLGLENNERCPNPDFNKPEHRWRMLQRSLVEAVADLLNPGGKVFLQSDIEDVALRMRGQFLEHFNGKLIPVGNQDEATGHGKWLKENPFGVHSDWEQHVMDRGDPMYRLMLYKPEESTPSVQPEVHDAFKF